MRIVKTLTVTYDIIPYDGWVHAELDDTPEGICKLIKAVNPKDVKIDIIVRELDE